MTDEEACELWRNHTNSLSALIRLMRELVNEGKLDMEQRARLTIIVDGIK